MKSRDAMYSPQQASDMIGVPESTLRRYSKQFGEFLSDYANRGRGKKYTDQDVQALRVIRAMFENQFRKEDIRAELRKGIPDVAPGSALVLSTPLQERLQAIADTQAGTDQKVEAISARTRSQGDELAAQQKEIERLRRQVRTALFLIGLAIVGLVLVYLLAAN